MQLIDIGVNLTDKQFDKDRTEVIERAFQNGIGQMILTGSSIESSIESQKIAKQYPNKLFSTAGIHPHDAKTFTPDSLTILEQLIAEKEVVAVGECD